MAKKDERIQKQNLGNSANFSEKFSENPRKNQKQVNSEKKSGKIQRKKKSYRVDVRMPDGRRITKSFHRKYDAEKFKAELRIEKEQVKDTGIYIQNDIKFKDFVETWFNTEVKNRKAKKTQRCYESDLKNYLLPLLGQIQLRHLSFHHARQLENYVLKEGKSARTVNKVLMELKTILNDAVKLGYLLRSPARGYPELKEEPRHMSFWNKGEIKIFLEANKDDHLLDLYVVALNTGLRLGGDLWFMLGQSGL